MGQETPPQHGEITAQFQSPLTSPQHKARWDVFGAGGEEEGEEGEEGSVSLSAHSISAPPELRGGPVWTARCPAANVVTNPIQSLIMGQITGSALLRTWFGLDLAGIC